MGLTHVLLIINILIICDGGHVYKQCNEYNSNPVENTSTTAGVESSVYGGELASAEEFPHMAGLGYEDADKIVWLCSGSLISEDYILTSAHCTYSAKHGNVKLVRLGVLNSKLDTDDAQPQIFNVFSIIRHPEYKPPVRYHDIALVKLDKPANFTKYVRPACLYNKRSLPSYPKAIATGCVDHGSDTSGNPMKVILTYYTNDVCKRVYSHASQRLLPSGILDDIQLCAGGTNGSIDVCLRHYEGPLQIRSVDDDKIYFIVGIISFGEFCGFIKTPSVYTRVSHYVHWIENVVWPQ